MYKEARATDQKSFVNGWEYINLSFPARGPSGCVIPVGGSSGAFRNLKLHCNDTVLITARWKVHTNHQRPIECWATRVFSSRRKVLLYNSVYYFEKNSNNLAQTPTTEEGSRKGPCTAEAFVCTINIFVEPGPRRIHYLRFYSITHYTRVLSRWVTSQDNSPPNLFPRKKNIKITMQCIVTLVLDHGQEDPHFDFREHRWCR